MKIIFGNLKMNFLYRDFCEYMSQLSAKFEHDTPKTFLGVAIPYIYLEKAAKSLGQNLSILAQDIHHSESGAFTSGISAPQIASMNIKWSLIGHSECRELNQKSDVIAKKVMVAFQTGLSVVYCCGKDPLTEIENELKYVLDKSLSSLIIAYEPIQSIGTGQALDPTEANAKLQEIRDLINKLWGKNADGVKLLYGGSVNLENYKNYLEKSNIDGVLVGGASLKVDQLWQMAMLV